MILVTGGAGFIGGHLVKKLVDLGYEVRVLDDFSTGSRANLPKGLEVVEGDIRHRSIVRRAMKGVERVIHLAAKVSAKDSMRNPGPYHDINCTGTVNLLREAKEAGIKNFVLASSCAVYGEPARLPIREGDREAPINPYGASKLAAEVYCKAFKASFGMKVAILRLSNVYGPRQLGHTYAGVVIEFLKRIMANSPPVIYGDGHQTRDFLYVEDAVEVLYRAALEELEDTFNLSTGTGTSIKRLSELLLTLAGKEGLGVIYSKPRRGEVRHSRASPEKLKKALNWKPRFTMEEGLRRTLEWFKASGELAE